MDVIKGYLFKCSFKAFSYSGGDHGLGEYNILETIYNMKINPNPWDINTKYVYISTYVLPFTCDGIVLPLLINACWGCLNIKSVRY